MKTADLYIRVSTDEQADKGYSQRSQEELLRKYCEINNITIRKVMFEDHSAKTFERPMWTAYLRELKKQKGGADLVLFLKWDRFSRNAGDAYQMISILRKLGLEPQAIEQPLDLSIPENKMMLAFYLAAPEVENDRRALNVMNGMRRARKEGRYLGVAPIGYENKCDETGRKYIAIQEEEAAYIRRVFETIAQDTYNTEQVYKMSKEWGFNLPKSKFWYMLRNTIYCGKLFIPKYKDEAAYFVKGQHEPLISESLFYDVQDILDGRKRVYFKLKVTSNESLPLRGFLTCPECGKLLTGSISKGHTKYYAYYHCTSGCNFRYRADTANEQFVGLLKTYVPRAEVAALSKIAIKEMWHDQTKNAISDKKRLLAEIKEQEDKLSYLQELLITKQIEPNDYRDMKSNCANKIERLQAKLSGLTHQNIDLNDLLDKGFEVLLSLDTLYETADSEKKRRIISSILPEKLHFENNAIRTLRVNEVVNYIYLTSKAFSQNKKGQNENNFILSNSVTPMVRLSNQFLEDLDKLANIFKSYTLGNEYEIHLKGENTKYSTVQQIERDERAKQKKRGLTH